MRAPPTVDLVDDADGFAALEPDWWELWRRSPAATPFQSPAWLLAWWRRFSPGPLRALVVRDGGALVALAPFYLEDGPLGRRLLPVGVSLSDYLDVLIDQADPATGRALVAAAQREAWDSWDFEELAPGAAALSLPCPPAAEDSLVPQIACPVLSLHGHHELKGSVPGRKIRRLRHARDVANRRGDIVFQRADTDPEGFLDALFRLHHARWTSRGESGLFAEEPVRDFHREACARLSRAGIARCYLLRIDGRLAAAYYGFLDRGRAYAYLTGFDPEFQDASPGSLVMAHAMTAAQAEGAGEFHFLRGQEPYKYTWGAVDRWNLKRSFRRRAHG